MDEIDYVASRVGAFALSGFFGGAAYATLKGFPRRATALKAAASCAIVGTSLFGAERLANMMMRDQIKESSRLNLSSYAFGGVFGGALNGLLYQNQPIRGMVVFAPFMLGIGMIELEIKRRRQLRVEQLYQERDQ
eukprot:CAMPEP_0116126348 /NCGR_PEP_ID=MMETSP0329-20121206/6287_1 /TAXON_ID=697910 /ORGANISM="Pseudo-nitzschia arenysensis, Strain B593" /LENGTH=134 /DNA_ID=CAMNT_0003620431 /DNA_START=15 /DNA_END=419 /DNA_ORIENTATION=+